MRDYAGCTLLLFLIFGVSCSPPLSTPSLGPHRGSGVPDSDISFDDFWPSFQAKLEEKNVSAISKMTRFPLTVNLEHTDSFQGIDTVEDFKRHFEKLFPEEAIRMLLTHIPDPEVSDSGVRMVPTRTWSIRHSTITDLPDGERTDSSIIYQFSRLDEGRIKLIGVTTAG